jgi:hypothetical protein
MVSHLHANVKCVPVAVKLFSVKSIPPSFFPISRSLALPLVRRGPLLQSTQQYFYQLVVIAKQAIRLRVSSSPQGAIPFFAKR